MRARFGMTWDDLLMLFVYGTLMRGYNHPMARHLADNAAWIGAATCRGRLYLVSTYPGLTLSSDDGDIVHGNLYALSDDGRLLATLDDYEGCGLNDPVPHPYTRAMIDVTAADGASVQAWTYVYRLPVGNLSLIASGRFTAN